MQLSTGETGREIPQSQPCHISTGNYWALWRPCHQFCRCNELEGHSQLCMRRHTWAWLSQTRQQYATQRVGGGNDNEALKGRLLALRFCAGKCPSPPCMYPSIGHFQLLGTAQCSSLYSVQCWGLSMVMVRLCSWTEETLSFADLNGGNS